MNQSEISTFLKILKISPSSHYRKGWVVCSCPLAAFTHVSGSDKHPSFGLLIGLGESLCHCFSCGFAGSQTKLLSDLGHHLKQAGGEHEIDINWALAYVAEVVESAPLAFEVDAPDACELAGKASSSLFPEWWLDTFDLAYEAGHTHPYLSARGVPFEVAEALDIRFDAQRNRICFPVRDFAGRLCGLHGRGVLNSVHPKYLVYLYENMNNPGVWLGESWVDLDRPVVFAESVFDLARIRQVYPNVVSPLSASLSLDKIKGMPASEVILMFDPDLPGRKASAKVKTVMKSSVVHDIVLPDGKDPGDTPVDVIRDLLAPLVPESLLL